MPPYPPFRADFGLSDSRQGCYLVGLEDAAKSRSGPALLTNKRPVGLMGASIVFVTRSILRFVAALVITGLAYGTAQSAAVDPELRDAYKAILKDPSNPELNFRYARIAESKGLLRRALAAYERVLLNDPKNKEAQAGIARIKQLLQPPYTQITGIFGGRFESNPRLRSSRTGEDLSAGAFDARILLRNEGRLFGRRWRSNGQVFGNVYAGVRDIDFGYIGGDTGPLINVGSGWRIRPAFGAAFSGLDYRPFNAELSGLLNIEPVDGGAFQRLDLRFSYNFFGFGGFDEGRDGFIVEVAPRFVVPNLGRKGASLSIRPDYRYNGATGLEPNNLITAGDLFPERFHQIGIRSEYFIPVFNSRVYAGITFTGAYRFFDSDVPNEDKTRQDFLLAPGAQLVVPRLFSNRHDLVLAYRYERNLSNSGLENYQNHVVGLRSVWRLY